MEALLMGWKVRRWVFHQNRCDEVPVFYVPDGRWYLLTFTGVRVPISKGKAARLMREVYGSGYDEWLEVAA
jgi:hypothetical protein